MWLGQERVGKLREAQGKSGCEMWKMEEGWAGMGWEGKGAVAAVAIAHILSRSNAVIPGISPLLFLVWLHVALATNWITIKLHLHAAHRLLFGPIRSQLKPGHIFYI